ncbi:MAG TPA: nitrite reductase large subunit NirB [Polyangia bacterium]|nr:nitrite reductase large subunit NirB [Polyangia bacterium]
MDRRQRLVVVGNGMVGHHFVDQMIGGPERDAWDITVVCEEPRLAYDRVNLSKYFEGAGADALALATAGGYDAAGVRVLVGQRAAAIDRAARTVRTTGGEALAYDKLVLATGSYPFVPPIEGRDAAGCFVYRTIDDLEAIRAWAGADDVSVGVVIGGGLLGLEAANALRNLGLETHVVEMAPRLMPLQIDEIGGAILRRRIEALGVGVHTGMSTKRVVVVNGRVAALQFADGGQLVTSMVVFSAGVRPRDELARACGLAVGSRAGIVIDDHCRTSDPDILAIGECASWDGRLYGLVAPGYRMAEIAAETLRANGAGGARHLTTFDMSTKLKLLGVDVASFGDAFGLDAGAHTLSLVDTVAGIYKRLVVSADKQRLLGGILVGDAAAYGQLLAMVQNRVALPAAPDELILPQRPGGGGARGGGFTPASLPPEALVCTCHSVSKGAICDAIGAGGLRDVGSVKKCTKAGTGCGSCATLVGELLKIELKKAGVAVSKGICEHFPYTRQELFHLVRVKRHRTFGEVVGAHGAGRGCEICKPAVASILASLWNEYVLGKDHVGLQDTNDRALANLQRDGTYSVVPRVPGGEITPRQLIALGTVAERFGLYSKITGAQRVDLFGATLDQLPAIWRELIAAGFESGHAYGKALRTVKSCVGSTWCRYGVQDSVGFAIRLENRYKGLRSPHKLKAAASGCARECAEAQGKDFGVIATEKGYNLYVCGNGGMKPQHAQLLASGLDEDTVIRYVDRFLMFYIRTADRLERTAPWLNKLEGGMDYLRGVVVDDSLGIAAELEAEMKAVVGSYQCEWKTTLESPEKLKMFRTFVNSEAPDPTIVRVPLRQQHRPATPEERLAMAGGNGVAPATERRAQ